MSSEATKSRTARKHRARLAVLDARWDGYVGQVAAALYGNPGDWKTETAARNLQARRRSNRGLAPLETVAHELRRLAERDLLQTLHSRAADPTMRLLQAEVDESNRLRVRLTASETHWLAA